MEHILNLPAAELCRLLSVPFDTLTIVEQALRSSIEKEYGPAQTEALRERACLDASTPLAKNHPVIRVQRLKI